MKKFKVIFTKVHTYEVEANDMDEATELALELDADKDEDIAWLLEPADTIEVEEIK